MKVLILICILVGLLVHSGTGTRCVCKCCTTDGCDPSTAEPQSFDLGAFCSALTCNQFSCSLNFPNCPLPGTAGRCDSTCGLPS